MKIEKYKKTGNKYKVIFTSGKEVSLYENIILKNNLLLKKEITEEDLESILKDNSKEEIYEKAVGYINTKMRTKKEITKYLDKLKFSSKDIEEVIKRLENNNLINDELYVKAYISDRINLSSDGPNKIKTYLLNENFDSNLVEKYISEIDNDLVIDKLQKLLNKKVKSLKNCSGSILKYKVITYFYNLGYDKDMIEELLSDIDTDNTDQGIKEYKKIYEKYKNKYDSNKLEYVIRQKLYLKGFDYDQIKRNID